MLSANGTHEIEISETSLNTPLSDAERALLVELETKVDDGLEALREIRDKQLYREHGTFSDYMHARFHKTGRRGNQLIAAFGAIMVITATIQAQQSAGNGETDPLVDGTPVPLPTNEYQVRPIAQLAQEDPQRAAEVWERAVELKGGNTPGNAEVTLAKRLVLTPEQIAKEDAINQLKALKRYPKLVKEVEEDKTSPDVALGLATALESCDDYVAQRLRLAGVRDLALIRIMNEKYRKGSETAKEVLTTGYLQFDDDTAVKLSKANAKDFQRLLNIAYQNHLEEQRQKNAGQAVSVVVFSKDAFNTFKSLEKVLDRETLLELRDLINEM